MHPKEVLLRHFGYPDFRPGQEALVQAVLSGRDALGILPTGGGKSVCYQVPALMLPGLTLVVSPLISLMADQVRRARAAGLNADLLNSTLPADERKRVLREMASGTLDLVLLAPERLETAEFREALGQTQVSLVAIDESHCIAEWGHDFRPSYLRIGQLRDTVRVPFLALTASATPRARDEIARSLRLANELRVIGSFDRPNLSWHVLHVEGDAKKHAILERLVRRAGGPVVAYAGTRKGVESLRDRLAALGTPTEAYHAGLTAAERTRVQGAFMSGEARVVVATNAFGMGVDKSDVRLVIHWQLPGTLEAYYQEAGRAGRDGAPARCVALHSRQDAKLHRAFVDRSRPSPAVLRTVLREVQRAVPAGARGWLDLHSLTQRLGREWSQESTEGALSALAASGAIRFLDGTSCEGVERCPIGVFARPLDPERATRLRRAALEKLEGVRRFASGRGCRRGAILGYFGEVRESTRCDGCDRCLGARDPVMREADARHPAPHRVWARKLLRLTAKPIGHAPQSDLPSP